ncbi:MAG: hypothetical protein GF320_21860 [Armatimonadia bacterium]|nr:hypothetical protein [Armatimonadia bacterium]
MRALGQVDGDLVMTAARSSRRADCRRLVHRARKGDQGSLDRLRELSRPAMRAAMSGLYIPRAERDDLWGVAWLAWTKALRDYDPGKGASWNTFLYICVTRELISEIKHANRGKRAGREVPVSQLSLPFEGSDPCQPLDLLDGSPVPGPVDRLMTRDAAAALLRALRDHCSPFEWRVLSLWLRETAESADRRGAYAVMARQLGTSEKSIDNALTRVRRKAMQLPAEPLAELGIRA